MLISKLNFIVELNMLNEICLFILFNTDQVRSAAKKPETNVTIRNDKPSTEKTKSKPGREVGMFIHFYYSLIYLISIKIKYQQT